MLAQFGMPGDIVSTIIWFILFFIFIIFGPRLLLAQTIWKLEKDVLDFEKLSESAEQIVIKSITKKTNKEVKEKIRGILEFFAIPPVDLDPYGIIKKIDLIVRQSDKKLTLFTKQLLPHASKEKTSNIKNAIMGAMTVHQIAKIVRHNFEIIKKYKLYQMAILLQMQLPIIARIAKAAKNATYSFANGIPIGDGIGPLVAAKMTNGHPNIMEEEEFSWVECSMQGRKVIIAKAAGPGASTGWPGKFLKKLVQKEKINRIITIDAGMRLEGEKPGTVAHGVGIAMGGVGTERYEIEEFAVQNNIPLDAIVIKVNEEEALEPMPASVYKASTKAIAMTEQIVRAASKSEKILIIGVGNTCGIGNSSKDLAKTEEIIQREIKHMKKKEEEKKKKMF